MMQKKVTVLGSTGSIGRNTLAVIEALSPRFKVVGLAAGRNSKLLASQIEKFKPEIVSLEKKKDAESLRQILPDKDLKITYGQEGTEELARHGENDIIVAAITGINGLRSTIAAVNTGKRVALANKESMVAAGHLIRELAERSGAEIIPVDSEHSGVFQALAGQDPRNVKKVILTASGGPFFQLSEEAVKNPSVEEALNHPRWEMGAKISIDSATLMNKGLELIEARWIFDLQPGQLDVLIHPQSIVHCLVEMKDGSFIAQLSQTDMKIPIQYALTHPEREESPVPPLDLDGIRSLEFYAVDEDRFPLLGLARLALGKGGSLSVALNAANEVAVQYFLEKKIRFEHIFLAINTVFQEHLQKDVNTLEDVLDVDRETKQKTRNFIEQRL